MEGRGRRADLGPAGRGRADRNGALSLAPGARLGPYEITAAIGAGGMGEVWRAVDTRLDREVALKLLPPAFAADAERLARFEREAKLLAQLNHPNVAHVYGFEAAQLPDGTRAHLLAMELVEGEDLAERLKRGPVPVREALALAKQIAEALEEAHEKGIVHRDLKPANVKVTPDGKVKVLDFGLAKAYAGDGGRGSAPDLSQSPTLATDGTRAGVILGTAAYMAPEQARGRAVDARADVWAFGCVLFEMLSGRAPFGGDTLTDVLAAVVTKEPPWSALPADTPTAIRRLLERALRKERRERLHHSADARLEIEDALAGKGEAVAAPRPGRGRGAREAAAWVLAALAIAAAAALLLRGGRAAGAGRTYRFTVPARGATPAISPDGRYLAFTAERRLWLRSLSEAEAVALDGTDGASEPFWSPDSRTIGFFTARPQGNTLKKVGIAGAPAEALAEVPAGWASASWSANGAILVEVTETANDEGWYLVRPGGAVKRIRPFPVDRPIGPDKASPQFLPDGVHFVFTHPRDGEAFLQVGSIDSDAVVPLVRADSRPLYAAPGFLLFVRDGALLAQPFDARALKITGGPQRVLEDVAFFGATGIAGVSVSQEGTLVVRHRGELSRLVWFDREGRETGTVLEPDRYTDVRLSDDGRRLAVGIRDRRNGSVDIWVADLERSVPSRLTSSPRSEMGPRWSPDGRSLAFSGDWQGPPNVYVQPLDGGPARALVPFDRRQQYPQFWSRDGSQLVYTSNGEHSKDDLWITDRDGKARRELLATEFVETDAALSPDGRLMAFTSDLTGAREIYLQSFPGGQGRVRLSSGGGGLAHWRGDGRELFYLTPSGQLMAVPIPAGGQLLGSAIPRPLFRVDADALQDYDALPDGQRFLLNLRQGKGSPPDEVIVDWPRLLGGH